MVSGGYESIGFGSVKSFTFDDLAVFITLIIVYIPLIPWCYRSRQARVQDCIFLRKVGLGFLRKLGKPFLRNMHLVRDTLNPAGSALHPWMPVEYIYISTNRSLNL